MPDRPRVSDSLKDFEVRINVREESEVFSEDDMSSHTTMCTKNLANAQSHERYLDRC